MQNDHMPHATRCRLEAREMCVLRAKYALAKYATSKQKMPPNL